MANTGSFNTTPYSNRYLTFSWDIFERSVDNNYTKIYWELKGAGSQTQYFLSGPFTLIIDGETVFNSSTRIELKQGTIVAKGYKTIYHNTDGSRSFSASASAAIFLKTVNCSGSGSWTLDPIPRGAKIISASDFTDMDNPTVTFDNPAGSAVTIKACISWTGADDIKYRVIDGTTGSYTFNFTVEERDKLRAATTSGSVSRDVKMYITTFIGDKIYYSTRVVKFTVVDCLPELNPTVVDTGTESTRLTGNPEVMIRGFNCLYASFNDSPKKEAAIISRTVTCGNKTLYEDGYFGDGLSDFVYDNIFTFTVTDNRGQTVSKTIEMPTVDYIPVTVNVDYETELNEDNTAKIKVKLSGDYFNGSFGAVNNYIDVQYIYRKNTEEFPTEWIKIKNPTCYDNRYEAEAIIDNVSYKDTVVLKGCISDARYPGGIYTKEYIVKIIPVFDWGENDFNFNVPVTIEGKQAVTYGADRIARAFTQETGITYASNSYIKLLRDNSPTDLYNTNIATFDENGLITIKKDMTALVNVHILSNNANGRSWIRLMNYNTNWRYTECIAYGSYTTSQITIILKLSAGTQIGVLTSETMTINAGGLVGSYIEIMEL